MQFGKCCYCETEIPPCGAGQEIEHFWPKSDYPRKRNLWTNLLLACSRCNHKKLDSFPIDDDGQPLVIDPTSPEVNPESEITFSTQIDDLNEFRLFGFAVPLNDSARGAATIEAVGLAAKYHRQRRRHYFVRVLLPWYVGYVEACEGNDDEETDRLLARMGQLMNGQSQYAGLARAFARQHNLPITVPGDGAE